MVAGFSSCRRLDTPLARYGPSASTDQQQKARQYCLAEINVLPLSEIRLEKSSFVKHPDGFPFMPSYWTAMREALRS
jgi:hypothetical protein